MKEIQKPKKEMPEQEETEFSGEMKYAEDNSQKQHAIDANLEDWIDEKIGRATVYSKPVKTKM